LFKRLSDEINGNDVSLVPNSEFKTAVSQLPLLAKNEGHMVKSLVDQIKLLSDVNILLFQILEE
jgi:hypothetical protein